MPETGPSSGLLRRVVHWPGVTTSVELSDVLLYSIALTAGGTVFAGYVVEAGHTSELGWLASLSGISQLASRGALLRVLRRFSMAGVLNVAVLLQCVAFASAALTTHIAVLALSSGFQGWSRGWYWTTSNARAAQGIKAGARVADVSLVSNAGSVLAPIVLLVAAGFRGALLGAALVTAFALRRARDGPAHATGTEHPLASSGASSRLAQAACPGAGVSFLGGALHVVTFTFVPALAVLGGMGQNGVGLVLFLAALLGMAGAYVVRCGLLSYAGPGAAVAAVAVPIALVANAAAPSIGLVLLVAILAANGRGLFMTLGPLAAVSLLEPAQRTKAMVVTGTSRSVGIMLFPAGVSAIAFTQSLAAAVALGLALLTAVSLSWEHLSRRLSSASAT